jgi:hypothetical protein
MQYLGDFAASATVDFMWSSNGADGASITRATNGTISVYKGNSATQTTTGVTDTEDFDGLTGVHHCRIATTDAFYATGNNYTVVLSGATIDGKTVNAVLAHFSIQNRYAPTPPTAAAVADAVWDEARSGHVADGSFGQGVVVNSLATDAISAGAISDAAATEIADAVWFTPMEGHTLRTPYTMGAAQEDGTIDWTQDIADAVWDELLSGHVTAGSAGEALSAAAAGGGGGGGGDVTAIDGSTVAAENLRKLVDGTGIALNNVSVGAVGAVTSTVNANMVNLGSSQATFDKLVALAKAAVIGIVNTGTNTTTVVTGLGLSAVNGFYVGKTFVATSGANAGQGGKLVVGYDGATKRLTIEALTSAMAVGDTFVLVG